MTSPSVIDTTDNLTPEESSQFTNLVMVGALSRTYGIEGHKITLKTLTVDENLQLGSLLKEHANSYRFQQAMKAIIAAASIVTLDGLPLVQRLSPNSLPVRVSEKFEVVKDYYQPVIDAIYARFIELEQELEPILSRLGKK